jgi:hypothetical protein
MAINGVTRPAFSAVTLPPPDNPNQNRDKIIVSSREHYGRQREIVEQKILEWSENLDVAAVEQKVEDAKKVKDDLTLNNVLYRTVNDRAVEGQKWYIREDEFTQKKEQDEEGDSDEQVKPPEEERGEPKEEIKVIPEASAEEQQPLTGEESPSPQEERGDSKEEIKAIPETPVQEQQPVVNEETPSFQEEGGEPKELITEPKLEDREIPEGEREEPSSQKPLTHEEIHEPADETAHEPAQAPRPQPVDVVKRQTPDDAHRSYFHQFTSRPFPQDQPQHQSGTGDSVQKKQGIPINEGEEVKIGE